MKQFMFHCGLLIAAACITVAAGMHTANDGLKRMKGYHELTFEQVAAGAKNGGAETHIFAIEEKRAQLEEMNSFNTLAKIGDGLAVGVQKAVRISAEVVIDKIQSIFQEIEKS